ncbi:MAG: hypothetical protein KZQ77_17840 [Candidatus Thiodiazotropha sp. (ex Notomyrtea botanica)]|nr:hypothetical protein [Candidatus Thiodiazotropha sp. (ex Notomyrtea botanica)]
MSNKRNHERLIALFLLGVLALNYPLLHLFGEASLWLGIPVLYLYLFCCWFVLIVLMALLMEGRRAGERDTLHSNHWDG